MNDPLSNYFIAQGTGWAVAVVLAGVVAYQYRENNRLRDKLFEEAKVYAEKVADLSQKFTNTVSQLNELFTKRRRS